MTQGQREAIADLFIVIGFSGLTNFISYKFVPDYSGPLTTVFTVIVATLVMSRRGIRWADFGLRRPKFRVIGLAWRVPLVMVLVIGTAVAVGNLGGLVLPVVEADQSRFEGMAGNLPLFMTWLTISWVAGAFGEEMIFRAFLLNRFEAVFENLPYPTILAVLAQGAIFGGAHLYNRGILAALVIFSVGSVLGLLYIKFGRNLWPTILGHGFNNSMSFIARFFGG